MRKITGVIIFIFLFTSCSLFKSRDKERKLQTKIIHEIAEKSEDFAQCTHQSNLFKKFNQDRIRVVLHIALNSSGQIERFKLDEKLYPENFAECIFKIIDLISFPKFQKNKIIEFEQPFIFSKE
ncbi:MAG: hypothetical protein HON90_13290 [Halobacteriovoraceae bacterium]|jgi:hypothetical protein|nr:hypothetical protein [Halobacteriovoraceae bacterium]